MHKGITTGSWKTCHYREHGYWGGHGQLCKVWQYVSRICIQVEYIHATKEWRYGTKYQGHGCDVGRMLGPVRFRRLPVPNWRSALPPMITKAQVRAEEYLALLLALSVTTLKHVHCHLRRRLQTHACIAMPAARGLAQLAQRCKTC
jgi:hypothetical protein